MARFSLCSLKKRVLRSGTRTRRSTCCTAFSPNPLSFGLATRVGLIADQADATLERMASFDDFSLDDRTPQMYLPVVVR
jgi:hypothetical protein